jgi:hypothetical protein
MYTELPVHVDGEPWLQPPGQVVVLRSALKVLVRCFYASNKNSLSELQRIPMHLPLTSAVVK